MNIGLINARRDLMYHHDVQEELLRLVFSEIEENDAHTRHIIR